MALADEDRDLPQQMTGAQITAAAIASIGALTVHIAHILLRFIRPRRLRPVAIPQRHRRRMMSRPEFHFLLSCKSGGSEWRFGFRMDCLFILANGSACIKLYLHVESSNRVGWPHEGRTLYSNYVFPRNLSHRTFGTAPNLSHHRAGNNIFAELVGIWIQMAVGH
jgi:hypothetical protein